MTAAFTTDDGGQALIVAAIAMAVLMGALVLGVDWGYRLSASRATQNQADAAAYAAARELVESYDGTSFTVTPEDVWNAACRARNNNAAHDPNDATLSLDVSFFDAFDAPLGATLSSPSATCTLSAGTDVVDAGAAYVRVVSGAQFSSLFGIVTRQQLQTLASARVRLVAGPTVRALRLPDATGDNPVGAPGIGISGSSTAPQVAIWPIAIRYDPGLFSLGAPRRVPLIRSGVPTSGTAYLTFAHYSPREAGIARQAHQLLTETDFTAALTTHVHHGHDRSVAPLPNAAGRSSCGSSWETVGYTDLRSAARCDLPNWFYYGFRGSVSVGTNWADALWTPFVSYGDDVERPDAFANARTVSCAYPYAVVPSCSPNSSQVGDWIETLPPAQVKASLIGSAMHAFIDRYGRDAGGGDKAVVVNVLVWDCSESFDPSTPSDRWRLNGAAADCSAPTVTGSADRIHVIAVVPFTIRDSDVTLGGSGECDGDCDLGDSSAVYGTWGNVFGDAGACRTTPDASTCAMSPLMNSAFMVPDE